ncbi:cupin domain-containing protein [Allosphingosinicella humi]
MSIKRLAASAAALPLSLLLTGAAQVDLVAAIKDQQDPGTCMSVKEVAYAPGQGSQSHRHNASVVAYVLKGAIESQVDDEPLRIYRAGEHWVEKPGAQHRISRNASASEPATFLAIMLAPKSAEEAQPCGY